MIKKFKDAISASTNAHELGCKMFDDLKDCDNKAKFALDILYDIEPQKLTVPTYIHKGLSWLQTKMRRGSQEIPMPTVATDPVVAGESV
ncbi:MAG: hypothetical protein HQL87_18915 [Magnetococcales bacterium]|nr:hypothetical protein [Magnetococcales bacterium]